MFDNLRYWAVGNIGRAKSWLESLRDRLDICHLCKEQAEYWCESCSKRHCSTHESRAYLDVYCCVNCAPTKEESASDIAKMTPEEREQHLMDVQDYF